MSDVGGKWFPPPPWHLNLAAIYHRRCRSGKPNRNSRRNKEKKMESRTLLWMIVVCLFAALALLLA